VVLVPSKIAVIALPTAAVSIVYSVTARNEPPVIALVVAPIPLQSCDTTPVAM
jgi:hypothetical protein